MGGGSTSCLSRGCRPAGRADRPVPPDSPVNRDALRAGLFQRMIRESGLDIRVLAEDELHASLDAALARRPAGQAVWVFAYGSLVSNPAFHFAERRRATVRGLHRRFCLWAQLGRGTPERPGLFLGLERGGACRGVVYRVAEEQLRAELDIVWRREMVTDAYVPTWVSAMTETGPVAAIAFRINHGHPAYAGRLPEDEVVRAVALAEGAVGTCRDYLAHVIEALREVGIADRHLDRLARRADALAATRR